MRADPPSAALPRSDGARGRPVLALALFLVAVFVGGALLAPWLYHAVQAAAPSVPALEGVARMPFGRYVNRGLLIVALLGLPLYVRASGIRRWADVGVEPGRIAWRRVGGGFALGFLSLAAVCSLTLLAGGRVIDPERSAGELAGQLLGALATALLVAVIEELMFRGAVYGGLKRAMPWGAALLFSSALYGIVHFLTRPVSPAVVDWVSGLRALPTMLAGMASVESFVPAFPSLTLAGVVLGLAYERTGDLAAPVGIHAGWIFWLKFYGILTEPVDGAARWLWGSGRLVDGWLAFAALVVVLAVVLARRPGPAARSG